MPYAPQGVKGPDDDDDDDIRRQMNKKEDAPCAVKRMK
jgi:hypothetical protein